MRKIITAFMMLLCAVCMASAANYLTFTAEEDGSTFGIKNTYNDPDVQYSLDDGATWTVLAESDTVMLAHKGDKALLRGNNPEGFSKNRKQYSAFKMTGKVAASGSVMSLIDGLGLSTEILWEKCFVDLFENCTSLTQAPELPATTLAKGCYDGMFLYCTSLTQAPELPATTLADLCYSGMFFECTSLTQAPELPATNLADWCYSEMFKRCTSLTQAPALPATTLADYCYYEMFAGCSNLTKAPELPATTLAKECYDNMFSGCTSLSQINVSIGDEGSGVSSALADGITVWTDDLTIFVRGAEGEVSLYDMTGKRVAVSNSKDEERALNVPDRGVYVVRTNGGSSVVLVR